MPSVIDGRDEFTGLPEALSATERGGTQTYYCTIQHRTIAGEKRDANGGLGACSRKNFSEIHPLERWKTLVWNMG